MNEACIGSGECRRDESVSRVRRFVTQMWEHPLLDQDTIDMRRRFRDLRLPYTSGSDYLLIPAGSMRWIAASDSDMDAIMYCRRMPMRFSLLHALGRPGEPYTHDITISQLVSEANDQTVDIVQSTDQAGTGGEALLLTPDEYIAGDLKLAAYGRLDYIQQMCTPRKGDPYQRLTDVFERIKYWPHDRAAKGNILTRKRIDRYAEALARRSQMSHDPCYDRHFEHALAGFCLPPREVLIDALTATGGRLSLDRQYAADHLTESTPRQRGRIFSLPGGAPTIDLVA